MSVTAAAVKTVLAQKHRRGLGLSSSQTKKGIAAILPNVNMFGKFIASCANEFRSWELSAVAPMSDHKCHDPRARGSPQRRSRGLRARGAAEIRWSFAVWP